MMLPKIISYRCDGGEVILDLSVLSDNQAFCGHFPAFPVLPGVIQVDWAFRFAVSNFNIDSCCFPEDIQIKFQNLIKPDCLLSLCLKYDCEGKKVIFRYLSGDMTMSSGRLRLGDCR